jgi:hypothetical protein
MSAAKVLHSVDDLKTLPSSEQYSLGSLHRTSLPHTVDSSMETARANPTELSCSAWHNVGVPVS